MTLAYKLTRDILEVKETIIGWNSTKVTFWYYDVKNWLESSYGKANEVPTSPMDDGSIEWVKRWYLPKVQGGKL